MCIRDRLGQYPGRGTAGARPKGTGRHRAAVGYPLRLQGLVLSGSAGHHPARGAGPAGQIRRSRGKSKAKAYVPRDIRLLFLREGRISEACIVALGPTFGNMIKIDRNFYDIYETVVQFVALPRKKLLFSEKEGASIIKARSKPVSYTHLDVYKRQAPT